MGVANKFSNSLQRSRQGFLGRLGALFGKGEIDDAFFEELEETLVSGDVGVETTLKLVDSLKKAITEEKIKERAEARVLLQQLITEMFSAKEPPPESPAAEDRPLIILVVGVNGSGKTTSAAKLAHYYKQQGKNVLLVAGDTFRAAAIEQLEIWADRAGVDIVKQQAGSDPAALFFDAVNAARARGTDVIIGDTAGRLHTSYNLMEELNKIYRVIGRNQPGAPHQVLLVIDATTGQNAAVQAASFNEALPLTGIILTKLDGTARGGIVIGIQDTLKVPVRFVGTGEKIDDLIPFSAGDFIDALLKD